MPVNFFLLFFLSYNFNFNEMMWNEQHVKRHIFFLFYTLRIEIYFKNVCENCFKKFNSLSWVLMKNTNKF